MSLDLNWTPCRLTLWMVLVACNSEGDGTRVSDGQTLRIDPDLTIGVVEGDPAYQFGDIVSIAGDSAGHIYVGDRIGASVRVYDDAGQYISEIAREGAGPGEISGWPADIAVGSDGRVYVRDGSRITVFAPTRSAGVADSVVGVWPGLGNSTPARGRVGDSGIYYFPNALYRFGQTPRVFYVRVRDGAPTGDTLEVPPYPGLAGGRPAIHRLGPADARVFRGLSRVPFAPLPVWDVTNAGTLLSSSGAEYRLLETSSAGDTLRALNGPATSPLDIPEGERADSARALAARLDSLTVPIDEIIGLGEGVREGRLPDTLPQVIGIFVAADGAIWVEHWPTEGQSRSYDVLSPDGTLEQRVVLGAPLVRDPSPHFGIGRVIGVIRDDETGIERVVRFTFPRPANRRDRE